MSDFISRESAVYSVTQYAKFLWDKFHEPCNLAGIIDAINNAKTIDAVEVRHGYNVKDDSPSLFECSICGWEDYDTYTGDTDTYNYCPNCGARMDGKEIQK